MITPTESMRRKSQSDLVMGGAGSAHHGDSINQVLIQARCC